MREVTELILWLPFTIANGSSSQVRLIHQWCWSYTGVRAIRHLETQGVVAFSPRFYHGNCFTETKDVSASARKSAADNPEKRRIA